MMAIVTLLMVSMAAMVPGATMVEERPEGTDPSAVAVQVDTGSTPDGELVGTIEVPMSVDCSTVPDTPEARKVLKEHNLCGSGKKGGDITPQGEIWGSCGMLRLTVFNQGGGTMIWRGEVYSTLGRMIGVSYSGRWENRTNGRSSFVARNAFPFSTSYVDVQAIWTGPGTVWAVIDGATSVTTGDIYCYSLGPVVSSTVVTN
jgi:hypothetical protein